MRFVFSRLFFVLLAIGFLPLSLSWNFPALRYAVLIYDIVLILLALIDYYISRNLPEELKISREFEKRFAIGDESIVKLARRKRFAEFVSIENQRRVSARNESFRDPRSRI